MRTIPAHLKDGIDRYVEHRIPPGHFLTAVLENDLREAFNRADETSREYMFEIVCYCTWEIPAECWGSPKAVHEWLRPVREVAT